MSHIIFDIGPDMLEEFRCDADAYFRAKPRQGLFVEHIQPRLAEASGWFYRCDVITSCDVAYKVFVNGDDRRQLLVYPMLVRVCGGITTSRQSGVSVLLAMPDAPVLRKKSHDALLGSARGTGLAERQK